MRFILVIRIMPAKRILILTNRVPYPLNDGGNMATHAMVQGYQSQGWQVYLLSMNTSRHYLGGDVLSGLYKDIYKFETIEVNNDVSVFGALKNLLFSSLPNHATRFQLPVFQSAILNAITSFSPDVIQVESVFMSGYIPAIRKATDALLSLRLHNIEWQVWQRMAEAVSNPVKKWYLNNLSGRIKVYEKQVWQAYDLLIPITETDALVVRSSISPKQIQTTPFGININDVQKSDNETWNGYHIGAMDWLPNQDAIEWFVNEVWPFIHKTVPEFNFYFAGRNMPDSFNAYNADGMHCMGEVADAKAFIADKKILIVPLRSGGGIRVKILEAMATEKLVISTSIGMQGIDAVPGIHYLLADTPLQFAETIKWAVDNKTDAGGIAQKAGLLIRDLYSSDHLARALSDRLLNMLADR
ncbi:MAG: glycosyltransferase [Flavipsychrobacter sp.]|nr:glycosyltransferase [Flavipsychrobacter sp.]